jgi:hypothetical protein
MARRRAEVDWKLLSHAINHTQMFEQLLVKRFPAKEAYNFDKVCHIKFKILSVALKDLCLICEFVFFNSDNLASIRRPFGFVPTRTAVKIDPFP